MYINVNFAEKNGLSPTDIIYLQVVNQNRTEDLQSYLNKMLPSIVAKRYTTTIKSGETRLNKEGKELLIKQWPHIVTSLGWMLKGKVS